MNTFLQLDIDGNVTNVFRGVEYPITWDENNYCTPAALVNDNKGEQFNVFPFYETPRPESDPESQDVIERDPLNVEGQWTQQWEVVELSPEQAAARRFAKDQARYTKRAAAKDSLLAYMAADNMSRVRSGAWTVQDLTALLADPAVAAANQFMSTLSFELAVKAIASASTPLPTPAIRTDWVARLQAHFYLEG